MRNTLLASSALLLALCASAAWPTAAAIDCDNFASPFRESCQDGWSPEPIVDEYAEPAVDAAVCLYDTAPRDWASCA